MVFLFVNTPNLQTITPLGVYQIGSDEMNLNENSIYAFNGKIISAHNSSYNSVEAYMSNDHGITWKSLNFGGNYCDPSVVVSNNGNIFIGTVGSNGGSNFTTMSVNYGKYWYSLYTGEVAFSDKPYLWYDNMNDIVYYSAYTGNKTFKIFKFNIIVGFEPIHVISLGNNEEIPPLGDPSIRITSNNSGCIFAVFNDYYDVYFTKTEDNYCLPADNNYEFTDELLVSTDNWQSSSPTIAVNSDGSNILLCYTKNSNNKDISIRRSTNGGLGFEEKINGIPTDGIQFHPWISYCNGGLIELFAFVFYDGSDGQKIKIAYSTNAGDNWNTYPLTNINNFIGQNGGVPDYIGLDIEYYNNLFYLYPVYTDYENGMYKSYIAPISISFNNEKLLRKNQIDDIISLQNLPNPFNPKTEIKFTIGNSSFISLKIFSSDGKLLEKLVDNYLSAGDYSFVFDGSNYASGIYYYVLESGNSKLIKKMVLIK